MTEPHAHDHHVQTHGHAEARANMLFAEEEIRQFQRSDLGAGRVVVSLMAAIFLTGLLIYTTILIIITS
jgi:hypothetical protein